MLQKVIPPFNLLCLLVAVSYSGHHDSLVTAIDIVYTKSFHLFRLLFLCVAVSHSGHKDSLVRGIVICYTKFVGAPHWRESGMPPCREGSCHVLRGLIQALFGLWPCGSMDSPPPIPLQPCKSSP
jgi:hypothetical protein